jgi:hypothetical protein
MVAGRIRIYKSKNPVRYCHIPEQKKHTDSKHSLILIIVDKIFANAEQLL